MGQNIRRRNIRTETTGRVRLMFEFEFDEEDEKIEKDSDVACGAGRCFGWMTDTVEFDRHFIMYS